MILLDTHVWIWLLSSPVELSKAALEAINAHGGERQILISAMSVWELFMLVKKKRLELTVPPTAFLATTHRDMRMEIVPVDETIARRSVELPDMHADPADRLILATAAELGCPLISRDKRLEDCGVAPIVW